MRINLFFFPFSISNPIPPLRWQFIVISSMSFLSQRTNVHFCYSRNNSYWHFVALECTLNVYIGFDTTQRYSDIVFRILNVIPNSIEMIPKQLASFFIHRMCISYEKSLILLSTWWSIYNMTYLWLIFNSSPKQIANSSTTVELHEKCPIICYGRPLFKVFICSYK